MNTLHEMRVVKEDHIATNKTDIVDLDEDLQEAEEQIELDKKKIAKVEARLKKDPKNDKLIKEAKKLKNILEEHEEEYEEIKESQDKI